MRTLRKTPSLTPCTLLASLLLVASSPALAGMDEPGLIPTVSILQPSAGEAFENGDSILVEIEAREHPEGAAVRYVWIEMNGQARGHAYAADTPTAPLYSWDVRPLVRDREVEIVARAQDWAGNIVDSDPVMVMVGADEPESFGSFGQFEERSDELSYCTIATQRPTTANLLVSLLALAGLFAWRRRPATAG